MSVFSEEQLRLISQLLHDARLQTIHNYSQGWPPFGSAKKLPDKQKPWLKRWKSGKVE